MVINQELHSKLLLLIDRMTEKSSMRIWEALESERTLLSDIAEEACPEYLDSDYDIHSYLNIIQRIFQGSPREECTSLWFALLSSQKRNPGNIFFVGMTIIPRIHKLLSEGIYGNKESDQVVPSST